MGQQLSAEDKEVQRYANPHKSNSIGLIFDHQYSNIISQFPVRPKQCLSLRKQKKHKIFQQWIPLSLPLVSKKRQAKNPTLNQEQIHKLKNQSNEKNYFSEKNMKDSFFIYESKTGKKVPKIEKFIKVSDENFNPNKTIICEAVQRQNKFRNTVGTAINRGMSLEMNHVSNYEWGGRQKLSKNFISMKDSIINQWFQESQIQNNWASEKGRGERRENRSKKSKSFKVEKASGIFEKKLSKYNTNVGQLYSLQLEEDTMLNIKNVALLQSRDTSKNLH